ncbi:hypothetical protein [Bradyrhizobium sp. CCBAU 51753]|uniref:hypothetical protein n=1 Tax=Bradyrhizobium sp. CCBAU 51753 TaxID=1325100 RepID=UPI00188D1A0C|nr:hypothetical protein [Bradyrhizobium sp. CCBAU 51753]QOZ25980.1 hypothetical protein XH93_21970 [Bradyrhizobium sp. CCBAU 51753]
MTSFEPFLKSDARFRAHTMPELGLSTADNNRNFFVSQLALMVDETYAILLRDPPAPRLLRFSPLGGIDQRSLNQTLDSVVNVTSDNIGVADIKFKQNHGLGTVYEITTKARSGVALIEAHQLTGASLASLRVTVVPKAAEQGQGQGQAGPNIDVDVLASLKDFYSGFREGLALNTKDSLKILEAKMRAYAVATHGASDAAMNAAFFEGFVEGLKESMDGFIDMFKGVGKFVFDSKFREEIQQRAAELIQPWIEAMITARGNPRQFIAPILVRAKAIGLAVGDEVGKEANEKLATMTPLDLAKFSGRVLGIAAFEVITTIITELIGFGVVQGLRWIEEGGGVVARLAPRLKGILSASEELKTFLRGKFGKVVETAEEAERGSMAGGRGATAAAKNTARARFIEGMRRPPPHFSDAEVLQLEKEIAEKMEKVGVPKEHIGGKDYNHRSGKRSAFHPGGNERGGCRTGDGIWVEGNVREQWPGFEEWETASRDTKLETIIAHEYLEMKVHSSGVPMPSETGTIEYQHAHNLSVQLANASELKISPEARKLLVAMRNKWNLDTVYLPPGVNPRLPLKP